MAKDLPQHLERHQAAQFPLVVQGPVQIENDGLNRQVEGRRGVRNGGDKLPRVGAVRWPPPGLDQIRRRASQAPTNSHKGMNTRSISTVPRSRPSCRQAGNSGIFLILMPESDTLTNAPCLSRGSTFGQNSFISKARSGPLSPSHRIRITEGPAAFVSARMV